MCGNGPSAYYSEEYDDKKKSETGYFGTKIFSTNRKCGVKPKTHQLNFIQMYKNMLGLHVMKWKSIWMKRMQSLLSTWQKYCGKWIYFLITAHISSLLKMLICIFALFIFHLQATAQNLSVLSHFHRCQCHHR